MTRAISSSTCTTPRCPSRARARLAEGGPTIRRSLFCYVPAVAKEILHLRCGSDIKDALRIAKIPGDFTEFGDPICAGPSPAGLSAEAYLDVRTRFLHTHWQVDTAEVQRRFAQDAATLNRLSNYDEILLWFEHDLYDQCILIQLLARFPKEALERSRLVCIGAYPGVKRFIGLGQLRPEQLATLLPKAVPLQAEHLSEAKLALAAWQDPSHEALHAHLEPSGEKELQFLGDAVRRHLQELPWVDRGLGLTDQLILRSIDAGAEHAFAVFQWAQGQDWQPYLGDLMFWAHLHELARKPLAAIELQGEFPVEKVALTDYGRDLLCGRAHRVYDRGLPEGSLHRWRGGLEQQPEQGRFYAWDPEASRARLICF